MPNRTTDLRQSTAGRHLDPRCPRFEWCTYRGQDPVEHDHYGVHAGDYIKLDGYHEDADGIHDDGFLAYLAHDDGDDDPHVVIWGFGPSGKFVHDNAPLSNVLMLLAAVKGSEQFDKLRAGVAAVDLFEKDSA